MRPWNEVTFREVAATTEGIGGWQRRVGKELTIQQKKYWQAQDEATSRKEPEQQQPAQARAATSVRLRKSEAEEAAEASEPDTEDDDDFIQYPVVVRDVQRPLFDFREMNEITDKMAVAQQLRQALEAAGLLVEERTEVLQDMGSVHADQECKEQWEVPTFWRHAVGTQPAAEQVGAAQQLRQALEAADSMAGPEQWEQCSECGDQESVCRLGRCVACCEMAACGCASADWRDRMRARIQSLSDSDFRSDGQPQW